MIVEQVLLKTGIDISGLVIAWHSIERTIEQNAPLWRSFPSTWEQALADPVCHQKNSRDLCMHPHRSLHLFPRTPHDE